MERDLEREREEVRGRRVRARPVRGVRQARVERQSLDSEAG